MFQRLRTLVKGFTMSEDSIVTKKTRPLPYVQRGMRLIHPDDNPDTWWSVDEILGPAPCTATLTSMDLRQVNVPCPEVKDRFRLYEDFDPGVDRGDLA
jgi:hypothetical protein